MKSFVYRNFIVDHDDLGRLYAHFIPSEMSAEPDHLLLPFGIKKVEIKACIDTAIEIDAAYDVGIYAALRRALEFMD